MLLDRMPRFVVAASEDEEPRRSAIPGQEDLDLIYGAIELPVGILRIEHCCPMLLYDGATDAEATIQIDLVAEEGKPYREASCSECGCTFRSPLN